MRRSRLLVRSAHAGQASPDAAANSPPAPAHSWRRSWPLVVEIGVLALAVWAAAHLVNLTVYGARVPNEDVREYRLYALRFWTQPPLFHHLPVEYPPLSIVPFTLSVLPPLSDVMSVFMVWMGLLFVGGYCWLRRVAGSPRARTYAIYVLIGAASTVFARFDLVPALVTLLALYCAQRRRFRWAYILLALGVLLKLYPVFLIPLVAIEQWRTLHPAPTAAATDGHGGRIASLGAVVRALIGPVDRAALWSVARGLGACAAVIVLGFGGAALLSGAGAFSGFSYAGLRPLQIESTPASLLWFGRFLGFPAHDVYTFHSLNLVGPLDVLLEPLSALALVLGCLVVYWRHLRGRLDAGHAFVACLCMVLVTNKIFSPQYLIWVLPLVAYVMELDLLWLAVGVLTTLIYPFLYFAHPHILLVAADWRFLPAIALRNVLLVVVTVRATLDRPAWDLAAARNTLTRVAAVGRRVWPARATPHGMRFR
ncbi:MAG TPA: glycosyltransferase 87 family protein [Ktedonobacterales bacterium]|nr:glycosyltransferase 87 family protein [Ktedonobacterales bacterium]